MAGKIILDYFQSSSSSQQSFSTERENIEVRKALEQPPAKRGKYKSWTAKERADDQNG